MTNSERIAQILNLHLKLFRPDLIASGDITADDQRLDAIYQDLLTMQDGTDAKSAYIHAQALRLNEMMEVLLEYTTMKFSQKLPIGSRGDDLDAIALGLNTLGEELESHIIQLEENKRHLNDKSEMLHHANKQLERFVYIASHDLQEPMRTISKYLSLLQKQDKSNWDPSSSAYMDVIGESTIRIQLMIKDLMQLARLDKTAATGEVDCNALVRHIIADMASLMEDSQGHIEIGPLPALHYQASELQLLFQNLISNALKYRRPDIPPVIHITATGGNHSWTFAIRDNGIGIEPKYHDKIFSIFQKMHHSKEYAGTGIGLALCKKIVDLYKGNIWVESIPGEGSTFYFTLPSH